jgi:hypothetical protein
VLLAACSTVFNKRIKGDGKIVTKTIKVGTGYCPEKCVKRGFLHLQSNMLNKKNLAYGKPQLYTVASYKNFNRDCYRERRN